MKLTPTTVCFGNNLQLFIRHNIEFSLYKTGLTVFIAVQQEPAMGSVLFGKTELRFL